MPEGCTYQLDSSAQSFFNELIITCKGKELERIQELDTLSCIISDMSLSPHKRAVRMVEGMGYNNHNYGPNFNYNPSSSSNQWGGRYDSAGPTRQTFQHSGFGAIGEDPFKNINAFSDQIISLYEAPLGSFTYTNMPGSYFDYFGQSALSTEFNDSFAVNQGTVDKNISSTLRVSTTETRNIPSALHLTYLELLKSFSNMIGHVHIANIAEGSLGNNAIMGSFDQFTQPANINYSGKMTFFHSVDRTMLENSTFYGYDPDIRKNLKYGMGLLSYKCPALTNNNWEPTFSKSWKQKICYAGIPYEQPITQASFSIPLMSSILGIMMPRESYKYIPIYLLPDLMLELRINPYAVFTSGYIYTNSTTTAQTTGPLTTGSSTLAQRTFRIKNMVINAEILKFSNEIQQQVMSVASGGLSLHTSSWALGPQYLIADTSQATGTWHINMPFDSMKSLVTIFLSNDYLTYPFCRKQFRCSRNLTWYQTKIGTTFYPSLAIQGNAGDTHLARNTGANNEFLIALLKAFGKYQDVLGDTSLNNVNFSINQRPYDVTATGELYKVVVAGQTFANQSMLNNVDTAAGLPLLWENISRGMAIYGINFETLNQESSYISGINTTRGPFELTIKSDPSLKVGQQNYDRPCTMMNFIYYDKIIVIKPDGIDVLGYGS